MAGAGLSDVQIMNIGLDLIEEPPAITPDDERAAVRYMKRNFRLVRDGLLVSSPWHWALKRYSLAEHPIAPAFGWGRAFEIPSDIVRVLPLTVDGDFEGEPIPYELESGFILTSAEAPLLMRGIRRVEYTGELPQLFANMVGGKLAMQGAARFTGKASYADRAASFYAEAKAMAEAVNKAEAGTIERAYDSDFISVREGGIRW